MLKEALDSIQASETNCVLNETSKISLFFFLIMNRSEISFIFLVLQFKRKNFRSFKEET